MMKKWLRSPWVISITTALVLFIALIAMGYWFQWGWTGFPTKTLWDWLNLLGVLAIPVVAGLGVAWYTTKQTQASEAAAEQQRKTELEIAEQRHKAEQEAAEKRHQTELEIANDNQREAALQAYIDKMSELLLVNDLNNSPNKDRIHDIASLRTLTVLRRLDPVRKTSVLQFLIEAHLFGNNNYIVNLHGADLCYTNLNSADLSRADLGGADLVGAFLAAAILEEANLVAVDLSKANLSCADLRKAHMMLVNLVEADLSGADLSGADLSGADLSGADLSGADLNEADLSDVKGVTDEQLSQAKSLKGATMPNGPKHP